MVLMRFPSRAANIGFARTAVALFASQLDFTLDELDEIKIAASEAVSNAVIHGYKGTDGEITVICRLSDEGLEITIQDEGQGIADVEKALEPAFTTEPEERMGLGLVFIKEYMDNLVVDSVVGEGTSLTMTKLPVQAQVRS
ncbi:MAG: anti-sigma F factor [Firmicutes bacterium]|nr:anti-sigma F factor [Bacillota bacterium]